MKISGFEFADSARFQAGAIKDAAAVGRHLEMLRQEFKGELTPDDVLDDAKNPNSPLHSFFEWSDTEAARQYRLQQARGLIRAVVAVYTREDEGKPAVRTRAYVHINEPSVPHYREMSHAMSQTKTRKIVLDRAYNELRSWRQRYKDLKEFAALITVIDAMDVDFKNALESAK